MATLAVLKQPRTLGKFTQAGNNIIYDNNISGKAKSIMFYFLSLPENWKFNINHMINVFKENKTALYEGINELIKNGYIKREQKYDSEKKRLGKVKYLVTEIPNMENQDLGLLDAANLDAVFLEPEKGTHINTNSTNTDFKDINLKNTTSCKPNFEPEIFSEPEENNDDVFLENFINLKEKEFLDEQQANDLDLNDIIKIENNNQDTDLPSDCPAKAIPGAMQAIGNLINDISPGHDKKAAETEFKELLQLFKNTEYNGKNIGFNEYQAIKLLKEYDHGMIRNEINWLPYRDVKNNPAGFLNDAIKAGGYGQPAGFAEKEKYQDATKKYGKVFEIWEGIERKNVSEDTGKTMLTHYIMKDYKAGITTSFVEKLRKTFQIIDIQDCFKITDDKLFSELKAITDL